MSGLHDVPVHGQHTHKRPGIRICIRIRIQFFPHGMVDTDTRIPLVRTFLFFLFPFDIDILL